MWSTLLKQLGQAAMQQWAENLQNAQAAQAQMLASQAHRQFIATLFQGDEATAVARLRQQVQAFDEPQYAVFMQTVQQMNGEAQQQLAQAQANGGNTAWGNSFEDRMALMMAEIKTGNHSTSNGVIAQAQQFANGMARVAELSQQFWAEKNAPAPQPKREAHVDNLAAVAQALAQRRQASTKPDIDAMLDQMMETGEMPDGLMEALSAVDDPAVLDRAMAKLKAAGADQLGDRPLDDIADYYVDGDERYALLWPLGQTLPLAFDELDRKTQFHVLFAECRRVLMTADAARNAGRLDEAAGGYREVLERADQIDVPILKHDGYQGLMTVEEKLGNRARAAHYLKLAEREREAQNRRGTSAAPASMGEGARKAGG